MSTLHHESILEDCLVEAEENFRVHNKLTQKQLDELLVRSEGLYELAEINPNGHIVDESIKGYLTFAEVDCYLREISEY